MRLSLLLLICIGLFLLARLPISNDMLVYEEGVFADILFHQPPGPDYLLYARLDSVALRGSADHPALIYEGLKVLGSSLPPGAPTAGLRLSFAALSLPVWLGLMLLAHATGRPEASGLVLAAMLSPLAILTSTQLQLDGSLGVLLTGPVVLVLLAVASGRLSARWQTPLLFVAAVWLGLGKQEWSMALLGALMFWSVAHGWLRRDFGWRGGVVLLLGLAVGNALSFAFDPHNYLGGFRMMLRVGQAGTGAGLFNWLGVAAERLPMLVSLPLLAGAGWLWHQTAALVDDPAARAARQILAYFALLLFLGFFASSWGSDPRYFAPALIAVTAAALAQTGGGAPIQRQYGGLVLIVLLLVLHTALFYGWRETYLCAYRYPPIPAAAQAGQCLPLLSAAQAWNQPDVDFVSDALNWGDVQWLASSRGRTLCADNSPLPGNCSWAHRIIHP